MGEDLWHQWRKFVAQGGAAEPFGGSAAFGAFPFGSGAFDPGSASDAASRTNPFERFATAARNHFDALANATTQSPADLTRTFVEALRDACVDLQIPWELPALGPNREHQLRRQRMTGAWRRMSDSQLRLQRLWADALRDAAAAFSARDVKGPAIDSGALHDLYDTWINRIEDAYAKMAHSEAFCDALAESVNAASTWRADMQIEIEQSAKHFDIPVRSEINSLTQRVKALETELRELRAGSGTSQKTPTRARRHARRKTSQ